MTSRSTAMTLMASEIRETPDAVARFFAQEEGRVAALGPRLRALNPAVVVTCARGSSDNAAAYFKYLVEILIGVPVASVGPSVASLYGAELHLRDAVVVSVSQSGRSPDIVALQASARQAGALSIAVVNDADSPLAAGADVVLPLHAGPERSVAATKSFLASTVVLAALVAAWRDDAGLGHCLRSMPGLLSSALEGDWSPALPVLRDASSAYVVGRGPCLPIAFEAALKLKETAVLHAEAFSGAEVMHGPLQLVEPGFPVLAFRPSDAAYAAMGEAIARMSAAGAKLLVAEEGEPRPDRLPVVASGHPLLDPLLMLIGFYGLAEQLARARGHDPDRPSRLRKVTETL
jgi:glucosamine--fructose-6-phosphate aminotransferase (isomerizing)